MDPEVRQSYDAQRDFREKAFQAGCYAPFVSLHFMPSGEVLVCCKNFSQVLGDVSRMRLTEIWNGRELSLLRRAMRDYRFDQGCQQCEWTIATGHYQGAMPVFFEEYPVESMDPEWPQIMNFALSNTCNFECIMCSGDLSSAIRARREGLPPMPKMYTNQFFDDLRAFLPHLRQAHFYGGEPFLMAECFRIWDMLVEEGLTVRCHVTTNASQFNARIERILEALPFSLSLSVDGATRETVEKIRVNCNFEEYSRNIQRFRAYSRRKGSYLNLSFCLMRQNWREFGDVLLLAESLECPVFVNVVVAPDHCSLYTLPSAELNRIVDEMERQGSCLERQLAINRKLWEDQLRSLRENASGPRAGAFTQIRVALGETRPTDQSASYALTEAALLADAGRLSEALEEALEVDPANLNYYDSLVLRGRIRHALGDLDQAEIELNQAIELSRKPRLALVARGWLRREQKRFQEGIADALRADELSSGDERYLAEHYASLVLCGCLRREAGDLEQAEIELNRAVELCPQRCEALFELGWLRFARRQFEDGIADATCALALCEDPGLQAYLQETLVHFYVCAGRVNEARAALDRLSECKASGKRVARWSVFEVAGLPQDTVREVEAALVFDSATRKEAIELMSRLESWKSNS